MKVMAAKNIPRSPITKINFNCLKVEINKLLALVIK
jgi:hypothetical protein